MPIDSQLTFGQLSTWRSIETFARECLHEVNVAATWDVRGHGVDEIRAALATLADRHESLRTTYHDTSAGPVARVHDSVPLRLAVIEGCAGDAETPHRVTEALYQRAFGVEDDPGWHAELGLVDGRPGFLALSFSHLVVDLWAVTVLEREFYALLAGNRPDGDAPTPRALAALQWGEAWENRRRGAQRYWERVLAAGPLRTLPVPPPRTGEDRIQLTVGSADLARVAEQAAALHRVTPQSLLMAACAAALGREVGTERVLLNMQSANRFDRAWQPMVSSMNQLVPMSFDVSGAQSLADCARRAHLVALTAYRHGCYDVDAAAGWAAQAAQAAQAAARSAFDQDCWFNWITEPGPPPAVAAEAGRAGRAVCTWTHPRRRAGHPFYLRVNAYGQDWVELGIRADPDLLAPAAVERVLRRIVLGVHRAAERPDAPVADLDDGSGPLAETALPERLFPRDVPAFVAGAQRVLVLV